MANSWVEFVKRYAAENNLSYACALSSVGCKEAYAQISNYTQFALVLAPWNASSFVRRRSAVGVGTGPVDDGARAAAARCSTGSLPHYPLIRRFPWQL